MCKSFVRQILLAFALVSLSPLAIFADDVVVVIDTNSSGIVERAPENVITSLCTVLSVPSLEIKHRLIFGEDVASTFIGKDLLVLTGQRVGKSSTRPPEDLSTDQIFAFFSINPFKKLTQISFPAYMLSTNALAPDVETWLKHSENTVFATLQFGDSKSQNSGTQRIVGLNSKGSVFSYTLPDAQKFVTQVEPLTEGYLLLWIGHPPTKEGIVSCTLELLDTKSGKIVGKLPVADHISKIMPSLGLSDSCFAIVDRPDRSDFPERLALITRHGDEIKMESVELPIVLDERKEVLQGFALTGDTSVIGIGESDKIKDIYLVDYEKRTATKIFSPEPMPSNFTITSDGKYLISVGPKCPQVALYDLKARKLLSIQQNISLDPRILSSN